MALTVAEVVRSKMANRFISISTVTFDSSYATGGEAFLPAAVGMNALDMVLIQPSGGYTAEYIASTGKIKVFVGTNAATAHTHGVVDHTHSVADHTHAENAAAEYTQNATTGAGGAQTSGAGGAQTSGTGGSVSAAAGSEVAASTNLSTLAFKVFAVGL